MEEKKEKKTIKCSYAVLVIILFAALAFVTDYAIIERKTRKCDCPKCEATKNEVISDNTDDTQVTEESNEQTPELEFTYTSLSGKYVVDSYDKETYIYFYNDGTWEGRFNFCEGYASAAGNYQIEGSNIMINVDDSYNVVEVDGEKITTNQFKPSKMRIVEGNQKYARILESEYGFTNGCTRPRYVFIGE